MGDGKDSQHSVVSVVEDLDEIQNAQRPFCDEEGARHEDNQLGRQLILFVVMRIRFLRGNTCFLENFPKFSEKNYSENWEGNARDELEKREFSDDKN